MIILYKNEETCVFILPRERNQFLQFLHKKGFNPTEKLYQVDKDVISVSKSFNWYQIEDAWHRFTGYDKILKKLLERYR